MVTLEELRKHFPIEVNELEMEYEKLLIEEKTPKIKYKFSALGRVYDNKVFITNYTSFIKTVSKLFSFKEINECVGDGILSTYQNQSANYYYIKECFYINLNNSTEKKIHVIDKICNHFGIQKNVIEYTKGWEVTV